MKPTGHEKRTSNRIPVSMTVSSEELDPIGFGYAVNISEKGLRVDAQALVEAKQLPEVGTVLKLKFKLPSSAFYLSVQAKIVYIEKEPTSSPQLGFTFLDASAEVMQELTAYVVKYKE